MAIQAAAFIVVGLVCVAAERRWPARRVPYQNVIGRDLLALGAYLLFFVTAANLAGLIPRPWSLQTLTRGWPVAVRVIAFVLIVDFGDYWMHRCWHASWLWRIHRWHHSPEHLYWLSGVRGSLPQTVLANVPFALAMPILLPVPAAFFTIWGCLLVVKNDWMHLNVTWSSRWIEWVLVTPRFHHVHHHNLPELYDSNYGVLLTVWDRLFGTYRDPATVPGDAPYGVGDGAGEARMAIGI
jgi:sterol desaturase/sphingolipid hydroxylase (fatty acid hydroxylase superfamily)